MVMHVNAQTEHSPDNALTLVEKATRICGTREALAKRLGVTPKSLREIATGKSRLRYTVQVALEAIVNQAERYGTILISHTRMYATAAHAATGQQRRYVGTPYIEHPHSVASLVAQHYPAIEAGAEHSFHEAVSAAWLHDVIEDTAITFDTLKLDFPTPVAELVHFVTPPPRHQNETRREHQRRTNRLLADSPAAAQTIKAADILDNISALAEKTGEISLPYLHSKRTQVELLLRAPEALIRLCHQALDEQEALTRQRSTQEN